MELSDRISSDAQEHSSSTACAAGPVPLGQSVIPLVNKLQDIFAQLGSASTIDLPQVAVVGSQSSGKSSVLEALVGRDFLPRGPDICTRRPLVLQLVQLPRNAADQSEVEEWGEFLHAPTRRFVDFSLIRKEIEEETQREIGSNKGISDKQIRLKIFSPNVLNNITLVDLPGITKVPVGDQPSDIESRVRSLIHSYIKFETCIILAVSPANADLANSDALQMARIADPTGLRTIGVITKLDIMDRGTDAQNFLLGNVIPLRLGYVGVVNRCQEDIAGNKSIRDALAYEESFFRSHPVYHSLLDRCGIPQLAKKLNTILVQHIRNILPTLKASIDTQIATLRKELASYGEPLLDQATFLLDVLSSYSQGFTSAVDGKNEEMATKELSGGARINYIFQNIFVKRLNEVDPCDDVTDEDIRTAIQNIKGSKNIIFVPEAPFEVLVRRQIGRLLHPSLQCAGFIYDELVKISHHCETYELQQFPVLRKRVEEVVASFLHEGLQPAERMICHLIDMEMDYINSSHPSFIGGNKAVELALQQYRTKKSTSQVIKPASVSSQTGSTSGNKVLSSIFGGNEVQSSGKDVAMNKYLGESLQSLETAFSTIQLKEPPAVLKATANIQTEEEAIEVAVTRSLIKSYYDIVRRNIQDSVPKAIMHFLVYYVKRGLLNTLVRKLYREPLFNELLQEKEEITVKRKRCKETLWVLQQAATEIGTVGFDL